ncbi:hypothetical protein AVEN_226070-1 [Araneus ventricosus]|uniref:Uncharacterized protein n=1 Tax=Araneus ventricosus TaxID=182803 RepID=A0A4Y2XCW7_ARAVE|nr:hypothetical protein AVEN_226070-1 [Araneus ventricosus]
MFACVRCPDESIALTVMKFGTQVELLGVSSGARFIHPYLVGGCSLSECPFPGKKGKDCWPCTGVPSWGLMEFCFSSGREAIALEKRGGSCEREKEVPPGLRAVFSEPLLRKDIQNRAGSCLFGKQSEVMAIYLTLMCYDESWFEGASPSRDIFYVERIVRLLSLLKFKL